MAKENKFLSWDAEIEQDSPDFILLPEGDYSFMVQDVEKTIYSGNSEKIGNGCPMAVLKIVVRSPKGNASIVDRLYLNEDMIWKLSSFFRSIGMKKHGEKFKMDFEATIGKEGLCHVKQEKFVNSNGEEKTTNKIEKYLDSAAAQAKTKPDMSDMPFEV